MRPSISLAVAFLVGANLVFWGAPPAHAVDADGKFAVRGPGIATCKSFLEARAAGENKYFMYGGWMEGYLSAMNLYEPETFDLGGWKTTDILAAALRGYCENNPEVTFHIAVARLARALRPEKLARHSELLVARNGSHETAVYREVLRRVQDRLARLGLLNGAADGEFSAATREALLAFQKGKGIDPTGVPDQVTLLRLLGSAEAKVPQ